MMRYRPDVFCRIKQEEKMYIKIEKGCEDMYGHSFRKKLKLELTSETYWDSD